MTDFHDRAMPCDACGGTFIWTAGEQAFFAERQFSQPRRCAGARHAKKEGRHIPPPNGHCPFPEGASRGDRGAPRPPRPRGEMMVPSGGIREGEVVKFSADRGFGFLRDDENNDYYFHANEMSGREPRPGMRVRFEVVSSPRGLRAQNVSQVSG